jgi:hypothetical protein
MKQTYSHWRSNTCSCDIRKPQNNAVVVGCLQFEFGMHSAEKSFSARTLTYVHWNLSLSILLRLLHPGLAQYTVYCLYRPQNPVSNAFLSLSYYTPYRFLLELDFINIFGHVPSHILCVQSLFLRKFSNIFQCKYSLSLIFSFVSVFSFCLTLYKLPNLKIWYVFSDAN